MSAHPPAPLRVLLAWPEPARTRLWRGLRRLGVDATLSTPVEMRSWLQTTDYYHMLYLAPADWRALSASQRASLARAVTLIVLGPAAANAADLTTARAGLYFVTELEPTAWLAALTALHRSLALGHALPASAAAAAGALIFVGDAACWPEPQPASRAAATTPAPPPTTGSKQPLMPATAAVAVAQLNIAGDYVNGDKSTVSATGDQIVHLKDIAPAKLEMRAGQDQVNIVRSGGAPGQLTQTAAAAQVNIQRTATATAPSADTAAAARTCPECGQALAPAHHFCSNCGREV